MLAHAKWFVDDPSAFETMWSFVGHPATVVLLAIAAAGAVVWRLIALRLPAPELGFLQPLARLAPWIPRLLGIHLGVALLSLAVTNTYLSPALSLAQIPGAPVIAFAEGLVGVWLISGVRLRGAAMAVVALGPLGLLLAGPVAVLEALDLLGLALFLVLLPPGRDAYGARPASADELRLPLFVLRLCVGGALIVVAFSEKLASPALTLEFLDRYPAFNLFGLLGLELGPEVFVRFAAAVEVLFGLLIISGASAQSVVIVAGIPFNLTLFFLNRTELFGHLPIYGAMLALLVYGSRPEIAEVVRDLRPLGRKQPPAPERRSSPQPAEAR